MGCRATILAISYPVGSGDRHHSPTGVNKVGIEKLNVRLRRPMLSLDLSCWRVLRGPRNVQELGEVG
jgi:hypothetical protein